MKVPRLIMPLNGNLSPPTSSCSPSRLPAPHRGTHGGIYISMVRAKKKLGSSKRFACLSRDPPQKIPAR